MSTKLIRFTLRRCSSVVEHTLGKGGVESPILSSGTIKKSPRNGGFFNGYRWKNRKILPLRKGKVAGGKFYRAKQWDTMNSSGSAEWIDIGIGGTMYYSPQWNEGFFF